MLDKDDRLALFGYGLFETLRINGGDIEVPLLHYERMRKGTEMLGLTMPDYEVWLAELQDIVQEQGRHSAYALRVTLSGGAGQGIPSQWLYHLREIPYTEKDYAEGISVTILSRPRNEHSLLTQMKSTNYMENILAKKEAEARGAREGIWLNTQGHLVEGTMSNLFFTKDEVLYTPSLESGCLPGTRRRLVLEWAGELGIPWIEGELPLELLLGADEIFLTNALMGIMPVSQVDECRIDLKRKGESSIRLQIAEFYNKYMMST